MKLNPFIRFAVLVSLPAIIAAILLFQLVDPSLFGEKHPAVCWVGGIGLFLLAAYNLYIVAKNSN